MSIKNTAATRGRLRSVATLDWWLIYRKETEQLFLERTGSHSELFKR
jgi:mRNA-degrading endonuclease YafQ of YafQ-DinJ toxin-antitoxin module